MFLPCCPHWQHRAEDSSLLFIRLFYRPSQQLWQLQPWSSLACFHYILCKLWHLISLREMGFERWGTRVAKPSSPHCLIYCTWAAGIEKCFYVSGSPILCVASLCLSGWKIWTFFILLCVTLVLSSPVKSHQHLKTVIPSNCLENLHMCSYPNWTNILYSIFSFLYITWAKLYYINLVAFWTAGWS